MDKPEIHFFSVNLYANLQKAVNLAEKELGISLICDKTNINMIKIVFLFAYINYFS